MLTKLDIEKYFIAEKQESLVFIIIGITALIISLIGLFVYKTQFWKGAAIPFIAIALLQIIVGYSVYGSSDLDRVRVVYALDMKPDELKNVELPRMDIVNKKFTIYRYVEVLLLVVGLVISILYSSKINNQFVYGIGLALAIQAAIMLGADYFAEKRALVYTNLLKQAIK